MQCRTTIGLQPAQCAVHVLPSLQCSEAWLVQGGYCRATCKLCAVPKTNAAGAASTPAAEVRGLLCICMSAADATTTLLLLPCSALPLHLNGLSKSVLCCRLKHASAPALMPAEQH